MRAVYYEAKQVPPPDSYTAEKLRQAEQWRSIAGSLGTVADTLGCATLVGCQEVLVTNVVTEVNNINRSDLGIATVAIVGGIAAGAAATAAFAAGTASAGVFLALFFGGFVSINSGLAYLGAYMYQEQANDPPDPNYLELMQFAPVTFNTNYGLGTDVDAALGQFLTTYALLQQAVAGSLVSFERSQGALQAGDTIRAMDHLDAMEVFEADVVRLRAEARAILVRLPALLADAGVCDRGGAMDALGALADALGDGTPSIGWIIPACSPSILDEDGDDVRNGFDACPGTPSGQAVDARGCPVAPADTDADGVPDSADMCPGTAPGSPVDANGCAAAQRDSDGDGVIDASDLCSGTALGQPVDANGCSASQRDTDNDGVADSADLCPNTATGAAVDATGCSLAQKDTDRDGVADSIDACSGTPAGTSVDSIGCPPAQSGRVCDVDVDGDVDWRDLKAISKALGNRSPGPTDPRDPNRNGWVDLRDVLICAAKCDRWLCAAP